MQQSADVGSVIPVPEIHQDTPSEITDTCAYLKRWMYIDVGTSSQAGLKYDTLRMYIERCAAGDDKSYTAFRSIDAAFYQIVPQSEAGCEAYRNWLISVLFLNSTNPAYFCNCVGSLSGTYRFSKTGSTMAELTLLDYLRHNPNCYGLGLDQQFTLDSLYALDNDEDPTSLPSLDSLGLGILLRNATSTPSFMANNGGVSSYRSSSDPFTDYATVSFVLGRMTYLRFGIFDALGRTLWSNGAGHSMEAGEHSFRINGASFPVGTLYARIVSGFGEVKTIKLIHR